jgi:hypothetical protein
MGELREAIRASAQSQGVSATYLLAQAEMESGLDPSAKAVNSSAAGLFQFVESTWIEAIVRFNAGNESALPVSVRGLIAAGDRPALLRLRHDPVIASLVAAGFAKENAARLRGVLGRDATDSELYLAHFLGGSGARHFLGTWMRSPQASAVSLFPDAARSNRAIFFLKGGQARSLDDVKALLESKMARASAVHQVTSSEATRVISGDTETSQIQFDVHDISAIFSIKTAVRGKGIDAGALADDGLAMPRMGVVNRHALVGENAAATNGFAIWASSAATGLALDGVPSDAPRTAANDPGGGWLNEAVTPPEIPGNGRKSTS